MSKNVMTRNKLDRADIQTKLLKRLVITITIGFIKVFHQLIPLLSTHINPKIKKQTHKTYTKKSGDTCTSSSKTMTNCASGCVRSAWSMAKMEWRAMAVESIACVWYVAVRGRSRSSRNLASCGERVIVYVSKRDLLNPLARLRDFMLLSDERDKTGI